MKYAIVTFGCRVNQADSLELEDELRARGGSRAAAARADLVIVNTCTVTATADQGARQAIRRIARENPTARIVVTGCYATRSEESVRALPVAGVVSNEDKPRLIPLIEESGLFSFLTTAGRFGEGDGACGASLEPGGILGGRTAYTLRVQTGCDERCTYCIIPTTRGPGRSRSCEEVIREARRVAAAGFKEIALTGVHLGSYGRDLIPRASLFDLLVALADAVPDVRFRISSLEPMDCTRDIVSLVADGESFAPHFHLPLQHGSERILTAMARPYTAAVYRDLVGDIRARVPHASIGTDLIAGFPGETAEDAAASAAFVESSPLTHLHVFPYSDRPGTAASFMPGKVSGADVKARAAALGAIGRRLTAAFHETQLGSVRPALTIEDGTFAVTDNYLKVRITGARRNEAVLVRITAIGHPLEGEIVH